MPYFVDQNHPDCDSDFAVVKEDGSLFACHTSEQDAIDQMIAVSLSEEIEPGGMYEMTRAALPGDQFTTEKEAAAKAKELGCEGTHTMDKDGVEIYMPCSTHGRYEELTGTGGYRKHEPGHDDNPSKPAPKKDQIQGSDKNKPGSAKGAGGDIKLTEATETALRNKVTEHNEKMKEDGKPPYTRTTFGQLAAVYRRGAGAFSGSHRPGIGRAQWAMARVNAYLYLLRNGRPENPKYITDFDLLPEAHPKSTRSIDTLETRDVNLSPPAYMRAAARRGLRFHEEGLSGDGLTEQTVREARAMAAGNVTADKWVRTAAWIARHMADLDSPAASPSSDDFPSPGVVAHLLWGSGVSKSAANRTMDYAEGVVDRLEEENRTLLSVEGKDMAKIETRIQTSDFEVRESQNGMTFTGYAALFNSDSSPLPFTERIAPGAFTRSLKARNDIKLLWNHDTGSILGSTRAGTLMLEEDSRGLKVTADLPQTSLGKDAAILLKRGDIDSMSFGFSVPAGGDDWDSSGAVRTLNSVRLFEVSIVSFPAYPETAGTTSVRGLDAVARRADVDVDALADAMLKMESGDDLTADEANMLNSVVSKLTLEEEAEVENIEPELSADMLELKKKKLEQLLKRI